MKALLACVAILAAGCPATSTFPSARTMPKGAVRAGVLHSWAVFPHLDRETGERSHVALPTGTVEPFVDYAVTDWLEGGVNASLLTLGAAASLRARVLHAGPLHVAVGGGGWVLPFVFATGQRGYGLVTLGHDSSVTFGAIVERWSASSNEQNNWVANHPDLQDGEGTAFGGSFMIEVAEKSRHRARFGGRLGVEVLRFHSPDGWGSVYAGITAAVLAYDR